MANSGVRPSPAGWMIMLFGRAARSHSAVRESTVWIGRFSGLRDSEMRGSLVAGPLSASVRPTRRADVCGSGNVVIKMAPWSTTVLADAEEDCHA